MVQDDLSPLKDDMVAFIAGHGMRRMGAFVPESVPSVMFEDENPAGDPDGWKDFVEDAKAAGAPFVTMSSVVLEPEDVATLIGHVRDGNYPEHDDSEVEAASDLTEHVGKIGYLQLGFAHGGVMFLWETATEWYDTFQELSESLGDMVLLDDPDED